MEVLWIATCEVCVPPGTLDSGRTLAFTNIVTWGKDKEQALTRIHDCFAEDGWTVVECLRINPVDGSLYYGEELNDIIERATTNPKAVIFGTFHTYKLN